MYTYLNADFYTLSGDFTFTLIINESGKVIDAVGAPKVLHSEASLMICSM
jgi:endo-1,4-beta-D-glucanase Y